ncbi:hypothetical protein N9N67_06950 [Bacteriovoracaceae bacterium]|nr:hypothetical protein [Bacteriovoracaceae bacterium]
MKFSILLSLLVLLIFMGCSSSKKVSQHIKKNDKTTENLYLTAQGEFHNKNYQLALESFKKFIESKGSDKDRIKFFWSINNVARIYLREQKSPKEAIIFFEGLLTRFKFNEAEEDAILEWISVSKEWQSLGRMPRNIKTPEELFRIGEKFYRQGMDKIEFPADDSGNADFFIAATYLVPYVFNYDNGAHVGKALFMLGNIRFRSWNDYEYWTENFYLKEVIRRYPYSDLSWKAYQVLEQGIRRGYTGSSGDHTPPSQIKMLDQLKVIAKPKK